MKTTLKRLGLLALVIAIAGISYKAGAAKGKEAVILSASEIKWEPYAPGVPLQVAKLWGDRTKAGEYAMLLKFPAGFEAGMHSHTGDYHGVTVQGTWVHTVEGDTSAPKDLGPSSYVFQPGKQVHNDSCKGKTECIIFIHQHGKGDFIPAKTAAAPAKPADAKPAAPAAPAPAPAPAAPAKP
jgi:hypothetical protein